MSDFDLSSSFEQHVQVTFSEEEAPPAKKKRVLYEYTEVRTIPNEEDVEVYRQTLKEENLYLKETCNGEKAVVYTYACSEIRRGCKYQLVIRTYHDSLTSFVSERTCGHEHATEKTKLTKQVKDIVKLHSNETPIQIQKRLQVSFSVIEVYI